MIYYSSVGNDSSGTDLEAKEASSNKRNSCQSASMMEKLAAMNATRKTELRQCNLAIILNVDTIHSNAGRAYFDIVLNYQACPRDLREGSVVI